jgi:hypothetical protein
MRRMIAIAAVVTGLMTGLAGHSSAATGGATTFVTVMGLQSQPGSQHISGIGLTGPWQGWHLAIDYTLGSDCEGLCMLRNVRWEMYSGSDSVWGTCQMADASDVCLYPATMAQLSGRWDVPVIITGGSGSFAGAGGGGQITGNLVDTEAVTSPAYGDLNVALWPA